MLKGIEKIKDALLLKIGKDKIESLDNIFSFFEDHPGLLITALGVLIILGAIFNWDWVCNQNGSRPYGLLYSLSKSGHTKALRIVLGGMGAMLVLIGLLWVSYIK